jgi:hypothetical protein
MTASQEHAVVCSVLVEAWAPNSGEDPLSYLEWCLVALATSFFRPSSRVGLVWERGVSRSVRNSGREGAAAKRVHAL